MADRKKVINDLNTAKLILCNPKMLTSEMCVRIGQAINGTIDLLKEQEPIPYGEKIKAGDVMLDFYECGYCKNAIRKPWKYCPFCGKAVMWE